MLTMHEATEVVKVYLNFQPLTSMGWRPLYWFLLGLKVNHREGELSSSYFNEYMESYVKDEENPKGRLVDALRYNPLMTLADYHDRTIYARAKILFVYLNSTWELPTSIKDTRELDLPIDDVKPTGNWDVVRTPEGKYFWLDGEWIWCGRR